MGKNENICDCDVIHRDLVCKAKKGILKDSELLNMVTFYKAFADNTRLKIINILLKTF